MRFENQVSLYDTDAIINKFTTQDTKINVVQGEIDLIVSEAEREELAGGTSTMYSQFADVKLDVEGLTASFSFLEGEFDTLSGQYSSLDSRLTTYKATVDGLSVNVSNIQTNLTENYSTTEDVHAYADGVGRNAISTAASDATTKANNAISTAASDATTKANNALTAANANTASLLKSYSTTTEMQSAISASASQISASVASTYATKSTVNDLSARMSAAELKITDSAIISTVLNSDGFASAVIQEADSIRLQSSNISWQSDYSSMTADGILTCTNANISGTLNSTTINGGYISGVEIWGSSFANGNFFFEDKIYNNVNHQSIDDGVGGLLICDDGISCVGDFGECRIDADGCMTVFQENSSLSEATNSVASPHITDGVRVYGANGKYASKLTYGALCVGMDESASLINPVFWVDQQYLSCSGSKDRIVTTDSYGTRALVCYEMPSPMFGDIGTGTTDESGVCYIDFNPIWCETVDLDGEYYVFLQEEGEGKLYVTEKTALGFCVKGTPGLRFSWEVKAYQFDGRGKYMVDAGTRMMESEAGA